MNDVPSLKLVWLRLSACPGNLDSGLGSLRGCLGDLLLHSFRSAALPVSETAAFARYRSRAFRQHFEGIAVHCNSELVANGVQMA